MPSVRHAAFVYKCNLIVPILLIFYLSRANLINWFMKQPSRLKTPVLKFVLSILTFEFYFASRPTLFFWQLLIHSLPTWKKSSMLSIFFIYTYQPTWKFLSQIFCFKTNLINLYSLIFLLGLWRLVEYPYTDRFQGGRWLVNHQPG